MLILGDHDKFILGGVMKWQKMLPFFLLAFSDLCLLFL